MSFQTGGSGYGAPAPQSTPPAGSNGLTTLLAAATAGLGVLNFLLGFTPFAKIDGIAHFGAGDASQNFFESGAPGTGLGFLLLGGLLAGLSLLPKIESKAAAAASSVVGFLSLLMLVVTLTDGLTLDYGAWLVLFLAIVQSVLAVGALLFDQGIVKAPAPKPATAGFGQGAPGYGQPPQQGPGQSGPYGQPPQSYPPYGQGGQYPQSGPYGQPPQPYGPTAQPYGATGQQHYGQPPVQRQQTGYPGYSAPAQQAPEPAPQYQPPVQGASGPTYGSSLNYGAAATPSQHAAPESDGTQTFQAPAEDDEK